MTTNAMLLDRYMDYLVEYEEIQEEMFIQSSTYQTACTFLHQYSGFVYRDYRELLYGKPEEKYPKHQGYIEQYLTELINNTPK